MNVSLSKVANALFGILLAIGGWLLITLYGQVEKTQDDLHQLERATAQEYVRRDDLADVKASLIRIEEKLDTKADKTH